MIYDPQKHHRRSIRLKGYDYSQEGLYFITICCNGRAHLFGKIQNERMILNIYGQIAQEEWLQTEKIRKNSILHEFIIMPNHIHGIIEIAGKLILGESPFASNSFSGELPFAPTKKIIELDFKIWQRNYYEHIIQNENAYHKISEYIINNPKKWNKDKFK